MYKAKDFDSYIANSGREARPKLKEIRKIIKSTIPKAEEGISWGVPFYKYHDSRWICHIHEPRYLWPFVRASK